ncbi:hypothetical protein LXL04_007401 [Taraxacum kok-saghyz]
MLADLLRQNRFPSRPGSYIVGGSLINLLERHHGVSLAGLHAYDPEVLTFGALRRAHLMERVLGGYALPSVDSATAVAAPVAGGGGAEVPQQPPHQGQAPVVLTVEERLRRVEDGQRLLMAEARWMPGMMLSLFEQLQYVVPNGLQLSGPQGPPAGP